MKPKKVKPHTWNSRKDASRCVECDVDFRRGDLVFTDIAVTIHATCLEAYRNSLIKLGILPRKDK